MGPSSAGYSLLELMVVLAILALIALVAVPAIGTSIDRTTLAADARDLATEIRALREAALDQQSEITLALSSSNAGALTASNGESIPVSPGTHLEILSGDRKAERFTIGAEGIAAGGFRLSRGKAASRVVIDRMSGRISIEVER